MLSLDFNERLVSKLQDYSQIDAGYELLAECRIVLEGNQNMLRLLPCAKFPSLKAYNSNHHHSDKFPHSPIILATNRRLVLRSSPT